MPEGYSQSQFDFERYSEMINNCSEFDEEEKARKLNKILKRLRRAKDRDFSSDITRWTRMTPPLGKLSNPSLNIK